MMENKSTHGGAAVQAAHFHRTVRISVVDNGQKSWASPDIAEKRTHTLPVAKYVVDYFALRQKPQIATKNPYLPSRTS